MKSFRTGRERGGYHLLAYSRLMILLQSRTQVNTCVLMQMINQNLTWLSQGDSPKSTPGGQPPDVGTEIKIIN